MATPAEHGCGKYNAQSTIILTVCIANCEKVAACRARGVIAVILWMEVPVPVFNTQRETVASASR